MTLQLEKDLLVWKRCQEDGSSLYKEQHSLGLQRLIWTYHKISGAMSFGQRRSKWRCLTVTHNYTCGENQTQHSTKTSIESIMTSTVHHSKAICPTSEAQPKLGHATGQQSQEQQSPSNIRWNGSKDSRCCNVPVEVQTSSHHWPDTIQTSMTWWNIIKKSGQKFLYNKDIA